MFWVDLTYRGRGPSGSDIARADCERSHNGPFETRASAERFAASVANVTAVLECKIEESANG